MPEKCEELLQYLKYQEVQKAIEAAKSEKEKIDWIAKLEKDEEDRMRAEKFLAAQRVLDPEGVTLHNLNEKNNETLEKLREISHTEDPMEK